MNELKKITQLYDIISDMKNYKLSDAVDKLSYVDFIFGVVVYGCG